MVNEQPLDVGNVTGNIREASLADPLQRLRLYERDQRKRTLSYIIWVVFFAGLVLGTFDLQFSTWLSVIALYGMALLCIATLIINQRGSYILAASILSFIVLVVITINLMDGDGVRDPGIMAYPIFVVAGTLFFGRRAAPHFGAAAAVALALVVMAELLGWIHPSIGPTRFSILIPMVTLLVAAAGIVWVIIRNMEKDLELAVASAAELGKNYDLTLEAWAKVMEYRDRETEGHSRRLIVLSTRLALALGMPEAEMIQLQRGALLHDIGKLAIPDEILLKPGSLDESEMRLMQKHPVYARQMLADIPFMAPAVAVAYSHHERWDGLGYPDGLQGEEIPLNARLFAVIDAWDALNSERVYRHAWPPDKVKDYLRENAGTRFDPHIVEVFLGLME